MPTGSLQSSWTLCDPADCGLPGFSVREGDGGSLGKNTGVGSYALLQGIFPTPGLNPGDLGWNTVFSSGK